MTQVSSGVIKKDLIKLSGQRPIGVSAAGPRGQVGAACRGGAQARIIRQGDGSAVVEVICPCGEVITIHCELES